MWYDPVWYLQKQSFSWQQKRQDPLLWLQIITLRASRKMAVKNMGKANEQTSLKPLEKKSFRILDAYKWLSILLTFLFVLFFLHCSTYCNIFSFHSFVCTNSDIIHFSFQLCNSFYILFDFYRFCCFSRKFLWCCILNLVSFNTCNFFKVILIFLLFFVRTVLSNGRLLYYYFYWFFIGRYRIIFNRIILTVSF